MSRAESPAERGLEGGVVERLVDSHRAFLAFLQPRVGSPEAAEEILQTAFVKALERESDVRDEESAVAWFYRLLRNAVVDHYRANGRTERMLERQANEPEHDDEEMKGVICSCMGLLLPGLRSEYGEIIQRVDLQGESVADVASALGISHNNASVRLHRARKALRRELERSCRACAKHGCLDCHCA